VITINVHRATGAVLSKLTLSIPLPAAAAAQRLLLMVNASLL